MPILGKKPLPPVKFVNGHGSRIRKGDVQKIGTLVWAAAKKHGREFHSTPLKPLLEQARDPNSPLHKYLEWDDKKAAESFRLEQIRKIVLSIDIIYLEKGGKEIRSPANISVSTPGRDRVVYAPAPVVWGDKMLSDQVKARAKRLMDIWIREFEQFTYLDEQVQAAKLILQML